MVFKDYLLGLVDNRGKNPSAYYDTGKYYVIDNYLIKNTLYPNLRDVNRFIDEDTYQNFLRGYTYPGMVIMTLVGNGIGNVCTVPNDKCVIIQNTVGFRVNPQILDDTFLYYYLSSNTGNLKNYDRGSGQPSIKTTDILNMSVCFPDISVQKRIVAILHLFDSKITLNEQTNNNLEQQAQALLKNYIESTETESCLGDILTFVNGFAFKSSDYLSEGTYKIITIKNVQDGKVDSAGAAFLNDYPDKMSSDCKLNIGDVLLSLTGNVGRVGIVCETNLLLNQRVAKIKAHNPQMLPFIYFLMRSPSLKADMERISKGTAQQNLSPIETIKLSIQFDESSACNLTNVMASYFADIVHNTIENTKLAQIRDALLPRLMSGEIDVSNIDISADKLLFSGVIMLVFLLLHRLIMRGTILSMIRKIFFIWLFFVCFPLWLFWFCFLRDSMPYSKD